MSEKPTSAESSSHPSRTSQVDGSGKSTTPVAVESHDASASRKTSPDSEQPKPQVKPAASPNRAAQAAQTTAASDSVAAPLKSILVRDAATARPGNKSEGGNQANPTVPTQAPSPTAASPTAGSPQNVGSESGSTQPQAGSAGAGSAGAGPNASGTKNAAKTGPVLPSAKGAVEPKSTARPEARIAERGSKEIARRPATDVAPPKKRIAPVFIDFQPDAVELETAPVPGHLRWVLYTVGLLLLTTVAWAYWTKLETFVVAQGRLVPQSDPIVIQAASGSPIKQMHVRFGDIVHAGDLLATLDSTNATADIASLGGRLLAAQAKLARLEAEQQSQEVFSIEGHQGAAIWVAEQSLFRSRWLAYQSQMNELAAQLASYAAQIDGNGEEVEGLNASLKIHREVEEKMKGLAESGSQSVNNYLSQKLNRQEMQMKIVSLINENLKLKFEKEATLKRQQSVTADRMAEITGEIVKTQNEVTVLQADLDKANRQMQLATLRVPSDLPYKDFYVLEAAERTSGSVVRETDPLFKLMPLNDPLRIEAEIEGKDIGEVRMGDNAIVKLDALPYQKHGTMSGYLSTISEGAFEKKEGAPETAFFKSFIDLQNRNIENKPENFRLVPGMTCKVELKVGKRRVIDYFLYPLFRHLDSSLREPSQRGVEEAYDAQGKPVRQFTL